MSFVNSVVGIIQSINIDTIYRVLFQSHSFPFYYVMFCCYVCIQYRNHFKLETWDRGLVIGLFACITGKMLAAFICYRDCPIFDNSFYIPIYILIWFCINAFPFDIFYKFFNSNSLYFAQQIIYSLIQVREIVHGTNLGYGLYSQSVSGVSMVAIILSSATSCVWLIADLKSRDLSKETIYRNLVASAFSALSLAGYIPLSRCAVSFILFFIFVCSNIINDIAFGLRSDRCLDITGISYLLSVLPYSG